MSPDPKVLSSDSRDSESILPGSLGQMVAMPAPRRHNGFSPPRGGSGREKCLGGGRAFTPRPTVLGLLVLRLIGGRTGRRMMYLRLRIELPR